MSNNFVDFVPNFTQVPNSVFDYWCSKLKAAEYIILTILCRKIFGWHKTSDAISTNQLMKCTGLAKQTVITALKGLEDHGLVIKIQSEDEFGHRPNEFRLNITIPEDEIYSDLSLEKLKKRSHSVQISNGSGLKFRQGVVQNLDKDLVQNLDTQKKDLTKEILTKEKKEEAAPPSISFSFANSGSSMGLHSTDQGSKNSFKTPNLDHKKQHKVNYQTFCIFYEFAYFPCVLSSTYARVICLDYNHFPST